MAAVLAFAGWLASTAHATSVDAAAHQDGTLAVALGDGRVVVLEASPSTPAPAPILDLQGVVAIALDERSVVVATRWEPVVQRLARADSTRTSLSGPDGTIVDVDLADSGRVVVVAGASVAEITNPLALPGGDEAPSLGPGEAWWLPLDGEPVRVAGDGSQATAVAGDRTSGHGLLGMSSGAVIEVPSGRRVWHAGAAVEALAYAVDGTWAVVAAGGVLQAFDLVGSLRWRVDGIPSRVRAMDISATGDVALAGYEAAAWIRDTEVLTVSPLPSHHAAVHAHVTDETLVVVGTDGTTRAVGPDGALRWQRPPEPALNPHQPAR